MRKEYKIHMPVSIELHWNISMGTHFCLLATKMWSPVAATETCGHKGSNIYSLPLNRGEACSS